MIKKAFIVLPTFNEAKTIPIVVEQLHAVGTTPNNWHIAILVVDDHSPDGTGKIIRDLQKQYKDVYLLEGEKEGLGKAYIRGFEWVLKHFPDTDYIFEMDADLSHHPTYIKNFLTAADQGYNFIIGARYIKGGSCPDWKWYRKILSFWGNQYIRLVGRMTKVHDCTSGFRCISTLLLRSLDFSKLLTKGYAFQMSLLHQAMKNGAKLKEIPIVFTDRREGKSKLGKNDIIECLLTATKLRWRKY